MLSYDLDKLKDAAIDLHKMTNIMIVLYDEQFNFLYSYPPKMSKFCRTVRRAPNMQKKCLACDNDMLLYCKKAKSKIIYQCHLGLSEAITPILDGNTPIGYLMLGQVVTEHNKNLIIENIETLSLDPSVNKADLIDSLSELTVMSQDNLAAATNIMEMCAYYLLSKNIIHAQQPPMQLAINKYIKANLASKELSLQSICHHFSISRSMLYTLSSQAFGMGISDYIRFCRIEHAKKLLLKKNMSIAQISEACGFCAPNHFTRIFKNMVGVLPKQYTRTNMLYDMNKK